MVRRLLGTSRRQDLPHRSGRARRHRAPEHGHSPKRFSAGESTTTSIEIVLQKTSAKPAPVAAAPSAAGKRRAQAHHQNRPQNQGASVRARYRSSPPRGAVVLAAGGIGAFVMAGKKKDDLDACTTMNDCEDKPRRNTYVRRACARKLDRRRRTRCASLVLWSSSPSSSASAGAHVVARSSWLGLEGRYDAAPSLPLSPRNLHPR